MVAPEFIRHTDHDSGIISLVELSRKSGYHFKQELAVVYPYGFSEIETGVKHQANGLRIAEVTGLKHRVFLAFLNNNSPKITVDDSCTEGAACLSFIPPDGSEYNLFILFQENLCEALHGIVNPRFLEVTYTQISKGTVTRQQLLTADAQGKRITDKVIDTPVEYAMILAGIYGNTVHDGYASGGYVVLSP